MMRRCHDDDTFTNFKCDGHVLIEFAFELVNLNDANNSSSRTNICNNKNICNIVSLAAVSYDYKTMTIIMIIMMLLILNYNVHVAYDDGCCCVLWR